MGLGTGDLAGLEAGLDEIVAQEKAMHSTAVTFVRGRLWSQLGSPAENNMLVDKALSGPGALGHDADASREMAFLIRKRAGVDSRGRPVYLRKYYHLLASTIAGVSISGGMRANTTELPSAVRSALETFFDSITSFSAGGASWSIRAKGGRAADGATQAHRWYEHHQLGDEWRGQ